MQAFTRESIANKAVDPRVRRSQHGLLPPPHPSGGSQRDPGLLGKARKPPARSPITSASLPFCSPASRAPPASLPTQRATQGRGCGAHQAARCPPRSDFVEIPPPGPHLGVPLAWHTQRRGVPEAPSHTLVSQVFKL